ncbi:ComF family protein [Frigidibacter oleivorans]|uniref:ComF family protein n=1 Tax=Frigidibacter oleivorans TaxID=2487129 RepID=UPI000F8CF592|nr:ComF family protein [Frigidibacter oleivorans]
MQSPARPAAALRRIARRGWRGGIDLIFPPQCVACDAPVAEPFGLCPACWGNAGFIRGLACDLCGAPLPGEAEPGRAEHCDDCLRVARPWVQGRAAMVYEGTGRQLVLALKHGDRLDLVPALARWLAQAAAPLIRPGTLIAPVPLHWRRLLARRANQSALLSGALARAVNCDHCPDLFRRRRATPSQDGRSRDDRFRNLAGAIRVAPARAARLRDRDLLIVDDVMTSGATFAAAAEAALAAGAGSVRVLSLARVAKDG